MAQYIKEIFIGEILLDSEVSPGFTVEDLVKIITHEWVEG